MSALRGVGGRAPPVGGRAGRGELRALTPAGEARVAPARGRQRLLGQGAEERGPTAGMGRPREGGMSLPGATAAGPGQGKGASVGVGGRRENPNPNLV
jgi:hypothetical protein